MRIPDDCNVAEEHTEERSGEGADHAAGQQGNLFSWLVKGKSNVSSGKNVSKEGNVTATENPTNLTNAKRRKKATPIIRNDLTK